MGPSKSLFADRASPRPPQVRLLPITFHLRTLKFLVAILGLKHETSFTRWALYHRLWLFPTHFIVEMRKVAEGRLAHAALFILTDCKLTQTASNGRKKGRI